MVVLLRATRIPAWMDGVVTAVCMRACVQGLNKQRDAPPRWKRMCVLGTCMVTDMQTHRRAQFLIDARYASAVRSCYCCSK